MSVGLVVRTLRFGLLSGIALACASPVETRAADGLPSQVQALYDIDFNGVNIGTYEFRSQQTARGYSLSASARVSLLLGAFQWSADIQSSGSIAGSVTRPSAYNFNYRAQSTPGTTRIGFTGDSVTMVTQDPPIPVKEGFIPVQTQQLRGVLDPMSAVLAVTAGGAANPCNRKIPIYDGTQRFDLVLSPKRTVELAGHSPADPPSIGYACRIRYVPISGYRPDDNVAFMARNNDIEIVLRPLPEANLFVPHHVTIPTVAGSITLAARRVNVTTSSQQQIALSQ